MLWSANSCRADDERGVIATSDDFRLTCGDVAEFRNQFSPPMPWGAACDATIDAFLATWSVSGVKTIAAPELRNGLAQFRRLADDRGHDAKATLRDAERDLRLRRQECRCTSR